jgi:hypothetical protein
MLDDEWAHSAQTLSVPNRSVSLGFNGHVYTRAVAEVVSVPVNYEVQYLTRGDRNSSKAVALGRSAIADGSAG